MRKIDEFQTPPAIANKMVAAVRKRTPSLVADFAVGSGELLKAAELKWPSSKFLGIDLSKRVVEKLKEDKSKWTVECCNFLDHNSRSTCKALAGLEGSVPLVILNPPFSCRGAKRISVQLGLTELHCSRALAFVINALRYVSRKGEIIAIVPAGCLRSLKDREALAVLRRSYRLEAIQTNGHKTFEGCFPHTSIVRITKCHSSELVQTAAPKSRIRAAHGMKITLFRGSVPMHTVNSPEGRFVIPLIHSTSLRDSSVDLHQFSTASSRRRLTGPAVLLPRVGQPSKWKLVLYKGRSKMVLSDCVFGLKGPRSTLEAVYKSLSDNWPEIAAHYRGTGAKYICVSEIVASLRSYGIGVVPPKGKDSSGN